MNPSAFAALAESKIRQYGQPMTFVQVQEGSQPDPDSAQPSFVQNKTAIFGMWDTVKAQETGTLVQMGDSVIYVSGSAIPAPDITDYIEAGGRQWNIVNVETIKPGSVPILYKLFVREDGTVKA